MSKLIALVALAAGTVAGIAEALAEGAEFEVTPDVAEPLLNAGQAKLVSPALASPPPPVAQREKAVKVRVLTACAHGVADDVVELPAAVAKAAAADGLVDADKAAVAYALSLKKPEA